MNTKILLIVITSVALVAAACIGNSEPEVVEVKLLNWAIEPDVSSVSAGKVTFRAIHEADDHSHGGGNEGGEIHELAVARKMPNGSEILGTAANIAVGEEKDLTLNLKAGDYELQCNVVEMIDGKAIAHYPLGMHVPFKVS